MSPKPLRGRNAKNRQKLREAGEDVNKAIKSGEGIPLHVFMRYLRMGTGLTNKRLAAATGAFTRNGRAITERVVEDLEKGNSIKYGNFCAIYLALKHNGAEIILKKLEEKVKKIHGKDVPLENFVPPIVKIAEEYGKNVGKTMREIVDEGEIPKAQLALLLNVSETTMTLLCKRENWDNVLLKSIAEVGEVVIRYSEHRKEELNALLSKIKKEPTVGNILRYLRLSGGMSVPELSIHTGVKKATIQKIEGSNKDGNIDYNTLRTLVTSLRKEGENFGEIENHFPYELRICMGPDIRELLKKSIEEKKIRISCIAKVMNQNGNPTRRSETIKNFIKGANSRVETVAKIHKAAVIVMEGSVEEVKLFG